MSIKQLAALGLCALAGVALPAQAQVNPEQVQRITEAAPDTAPAKPEKPRKLLVYTRANGFVHGSIPVGAKAMEILGQKSGAFEATISDDPAAFEPDNLKQFDAVMFLSTTGDAFQPKGFNDLADDTKQTARDNEKRYQEALLQFVRDGKGFAGIHAATDTYYSWPAFGEMIGGYFNGHPWNAGDTETFRVEVPNHPIMAAFKGHEDHEFELQDEIYQFKAPYDRTKMRVLLGLEVDKTPKKGGMNRPDNDYAVTWIKNYEKGRVFYSSLGHNEHIYWNPEVLRQYLAGLQFAMGDLKVDTRSLPQIDKIVDGRTIYKPTAMDDAVMGEYSGTYLPSPQAAVAPQPASARVIAEGNGEYRLVFIPREVLSNDAANNMEVRGRLQDGKIVFAGQRSGQQGDAEYSGTLEDGKLKLSGAGEFELQKVNRASPTLGARPPANAVVLLPYAADQPLPANALDEWRNPNWLPMNDGSAQVNGGDNLTKRDFGDVQLHVEFMTPYMPGARGQSRGNSGVYLQDRYEVQVLDSFGFGRADNQAGGIYRVSMPDVDAILPPGSWNTYDITYRAPRLRDDGTVREPAIVTAKLNGETIHDQRALWHPTGGGAGGFATMAPIKLQDHGDAVRYRNIWALPLDAPVADAAFAGDLAKWQTLFAGQPSDLDQWTGKPGGWKIEDGVLAAQPEAGDLWTKERFGNFVLDLEYKISPEGNSGVFIRTDSPANWLHTSIEIQVFDSKGKDKSTHTTGAVYDVRAPDREMSKPAGEWNDMTITARDNKIYVVVNGEQVVDMNLDDWKEAHKNPDGSPNKFNTAYKDMKREGHIGLQYHGNPVSYRNIRIRELD